MTARRTLIFFVVLSLIFGATYLIIQFTKGYEFDISKKNFRPTGLLVATSLPDGGQVFVDGKLTGATNTTFYLTPNTYNIEVEKDGFYTWHKTIKIEKDIVSKIDAWLFPLAPDFKALTFTGVGVPLISPDGTKIVYQATSSTSNKKGLWILELNDLPFGLSREPRLIAQNTTKIDLSKTNYIWSPDSRQILVGLKQGKTEENYLLDPNNSNQLINTANNSPAIKIQWSQEIAFLHDQKIAQLPPTLAKLIKENTTQALFSPDETKILYTATASATIPQIIKPPLPGAHNQPEERQIQPNKIYVYNIKEDQNFFIMDNPLSKDKQFRCQNNNLLSENSTCSLSWFPNSKHLFIAEKDKISAVEYDGANLTTIYAGPYQFPIASPLPSGNKFLLLTTLNNTPNSSLNFYAISLR